MKSPHPYPKPTGRSIPPIHTKTQVIQTDPYPNFDATRLFVYIIAFPWKINDSPGYRFNLVLKCSEDFTLTHFYVSGALASLDRWVSRWKNSGESPGFWLGCFVDILNIIW